MWVEKPRQVSRAEKWRSSRLGRRKNMRYDSLGLLLVSKNILFFGGWEEFKHRYPKRGFKVSSNISPAIMSRWTGKQPARIWCYYNVTYCEVSLVFLFLLFKPWTEISQRQAYKTLKNNFLLNVQYHHSWLDVEDQKEWSYLLFSLLSLWYMFPGHIILF